jgi:CRP-like cAMP-binding protein
LIQFKKHERSFVLIKENSLTKAQKTLLEFHEKFELFRGMTSEDLLAVVEKVWFVKLEKDEKVFSKGHTGKELFYIIDGQVSIEVADEKEITVLKNKTFFGEIAFITKKPRGATATVISNEAKLLSILIKDVVEPNEPRAFSKLYQNMSEVLIKKVEEMNRRFIEDC